MIYPPFDLAARRLQLWQELVDVPKHLPELMTVERFWAYPGFEVMHQLAYYQNTEQWALFEQLAHNTTQALTQQTHRKQPFIPFSTNLSNLDKPAVSQVSGLLPYDRRSAARKSYFEVLIIHPNPAEFEGLYRRRLASFKTDKDEFLFDVLFVDNVEDALVAVLANDSIEACVFLHGFEQHSSIDSKIFQQYESFLEPDWQTKLCENPLLGLNHVIRQLRPQLLHYFISEIPLAQILPEVRAQFQRILYHLDPFQDLHHTLLSGIRERYTTPFFDALRAYSRKPKGVFHALPLSRAQSIHDSHWITDMLDFYGANVFMAETSSTQGGMDSLLDPKGAIKQAHEKTASTFGSQESFFVTNGTSTSNKIVMQANLCPGDLVLTSSDCHKSIPYAVMLSGAYPIFLETYPLRQYDLYGAVPLERIKSILLDLKDQGELHRVRQITLTNSTFDGLVYDVERFMMEILAIKPDIIFHWDEAWFAYAYFNPIYAKRTAMPVAKMLQGRFASEAYAEFYASWKKKVLSKLEKSKGLDKWVQTQLYPDPDQVKLRVYATQSTHKTLTSFRQGSMLHVHDVFWNPDLFLEAYRTHTSTSPNYQIIASLDVGRRQVSLEGYERVKRAIGLGIYLKTSIFNSQKLKPFFKLLNDEELIPKEARSPQTEAVVHYADFPKSWAQALFVVDPTRITLDIRGTGLDGSSFRELLINRYDIQVNKTSRHTVLFIVNIGATRASVDYLLGVLHEMSDRFRQKPSSLVSKGLKEQVVELPQRRLFHSKFVPYSGKQWSSVNMREAYYLAYEESNIMYVPLDQETLKEVMNDRKLVSAAFVTPYPPGFPVLVPGQLITHDILLYLQKMRIKEIHGYRPDLGLKVFKDSIL